MSFSDRQIFLQELMAVRNDAVAYARGEHREGSKLRDRCAEMICSVDNLLSELVGDHAYTNLKQA